ncbi:MAG: STAS domain-containing protein [Candidatus Omnitrophica bacterium]|nr:STAS domain-containing protein [Candidatus Omnitrophota bacterium]
MSLDIKIIKKRDYVYSAELAGAIDGESYQQLEEELKEIIDEKTKAVILDMGRVDYISSIGIRVVVWAKKQLQKRNATFAMINLQPQIKKVFEMMKILPMVDIFSNMPEADKYIDQIIKDEIAKKNP